MVYGSEAVLSTDLEYGSPRLKAYNEQSNKETLENAVDQLEKARDMALLNSARYQQKLRRYHDKHVRRRDLNVGDLVLQQRQSNQGRHKLTAPWEGPYVVAEVLKPGTYKLTDEKGAIFTNAWNIEQPGAPNSAPIECRNSSRVKRHAQRGKRRTATASSFPCKPRYAPAKASRGRRLTRRKGSTVDLEHQSQGCPASGRKSRPASRTRWGCPR